MSLKLIFFLLSLLPCLHLSLLPLPIPQDVSRFGEKHSEWLFGGGNIFNLAMCVHALMVTAKLNEWILSGVTLKESLSEAVPHLAIMLHISYSGCDKLRLIISEVLSMGTGKTQYWKSTCFATSVIIVGAIQSL